MEVVIENRQINWKLMQDVHDLGEVCGLYQDGFNDKSTSSQFSEWEDIDYLCYLQIYFSEKPYYGRRLRYFNCAPWWYKNEFFIPDTYYDSKIKISVQYILCGY